jgi:hypothetical protein
MPLPEPPNGRLERLHYYAQCVAILSKAKQWERVRVVKALCLLVGINRPNAAGDKCIVYGCTNRKGQGVFVGDICGPCRRHLISGEVGPTASFLGEMRARLEDCAAYLAFHGPVGATPDSAALLLKDVRKVLHYPTPNDGGQRP